MIHLSDQNGEKMYELIEWHMGESPSSTGIIPYHRYWTTFTFLIRNVANIFNFFSYYISRIVLIHLIYGKEVLHWKFAFTDQLFYFVLKDD